MLHCLCKKVLLYNQLATELPQSPNKIPEWNWSIEKTPVVRFGPCCSALPLPSSLKVSRSFSEALIQRPRDLNPMDWLHHTPQDTGQHLPPTPFSPLILCHLHLWVFIWPCAFEFPPGSVFLCFSFLCFPFPPNLPFTLTEFLPLFIWGGIHLSISFYILFHVTNICSKKVLKENEVCTVN